MLNAQTSGEGINRQQNFTSWRLETKELCGSRGGLQSDHLAAPTDVVMLLFSCRGKVSETQKNKQVVRVCGLLLGEAAVAPGTHPPVGRKREVGVGVEGQTGVEHGAP